MWVKDTTQTHAAAAATKLSTLKLKSCYMCMYVLSDNIYATEIILPWPIIMGLKIVVNKYCIQ